MQKHRNCTPCPQILSLSQPDLDNQKYVEQTTSYSEAQQYTNLISQMRKDIVVPIPVPRSLPQTQPIWRMAIDMAAHTQTASQSYCNI